MIIPMPKLVATSPSALAEPAPDVLHLDLRRQAWALSREDRHSEAAKVWRDILALQADDADAADELGLALGAHGDHGEAVAAFQRSLHFRPDSVSTRRHLGSALVKAGRHADAQFHFEDILGKHPRDPEALTGLGQALRGLQRFEAALRYAQEALALKPDADAAHTAAECLVALKRKDEAVPLFRRALELHPAHKDATIGLASLLHENEDWAEAIKLLQDFVAAHPAEVSGWSTLATAHLGARNHTRSIDAFRRALALEPTSAALLCNMSIALGGLHRTEEAIDACYAALAIEPHSRTAQFNPACLCLSLRRFSEGWRAYEFRFGGDHRTVRGDVVAPPWRGEDLRGKSILVLGEQASGDYLHFARYLATLAEIAEVTFFGPKRLIRLLSTVPGKIQFIHEIQRGTRYDYQCHLMSVPGRFHERGWPIPTATYLSAEPDRLERWRTRIGTDGFKIGIVWHGSIYDGKKSTRAFPLERLMPLADLPGVRLISLQLGTGSEERDRLPDPAKVETLGPDFDKGEDGFIDAAAVMACMDLVITCDTSLAHLAGALGRPTWIALNSNPEWRWQLAGDDSYWYPSVRLFRQKSWGDWDGVFLQMVEALQPLLATSGGEAIPSSGKPAPTPQVAISWGECIDKLTILEIKARNVTSPEAAHNIARERSELAAALSQISPADPEIDRARADLRRINETLWNIEDEIRACETAGTFDARFVELSRSIYRTNDERARVKRTINRLTGSAIVEEKLYGHPPNAEPPKAFSD